MAFSDVIKRIKIDPAFSKADTRDINKVYRSIYNNSVTARKMLDKLVSSNKTLKITFKAGKLQAKTGRFQILLDPSIIPGKGIIGTDGRVFDATLERVLVHESVHAIDGKRDPKRKDLFTSNFDYYGPTVRKTNKILKEKGITNERASYFSVASIGSVLKKNFQYTNGNKVDIGLVSNRAIIDTSKNTSPETSDLLIGINASNSIKSGGKQDYLYGEKGDDTLEGGGDNDLLDGGTGTDTGVFSGKFDDYSFIKLNKTTWTIEHTNGKNKDGKDTLRHVEKAQFSDTRIDLIGGEDIVFAIDVSGSMRDDINSVKTKSQEILETIFGKDNQSVDNRVGILTFNDTNSINTVLKFTDQASISKRKEAALDGINRVSILGGGEEPLNGALLHALNGNLGSWRNDATKRRIIVFTDEPPADPDLASQVAQKSATIGAPIQKNPGVSLTTPNTNSGGGGGFFPPVKVSPVTIETSAETSGRIGLGVEIFTVAIGNSPETITALQDIADNNRGKAFRAENADQLVDVLLEAIQSPPTTPQPIVPPNGIRLIGDRSDNNLSGTPQDDYLRGGRGKDQLNGGPGNDFLIGNSGDDDLDGGAGDDTLIGGKGSDLIKGKAGDDILYGGPDKKTDTLVGGNGADTFAFDSNLIGKDIVKDFVSGEDKLAFIGITNLQQLKFTTLGQGTLISLGRFNEVFIEGTKPRQIRANIVLVENHAELGLGNRGNDQLNGGAGDDTLNGGKGSDVINGNGGKDIIIGGRDKDIDVLFGGDDADIFAFDSKLIGRDIVRDFSDNEDKLAFVGVKNRKQLKFKTTGQDTLISLGQTNEVLVKGISPQQLQDNLVFVESFSDT